VRTSPSFVDPGALVPVTTALFEIAIGELTSAFGPPRLAPAPEPQERPTRQATTTTVAGTSPVPTGTDAVAVAALATPLQSGVAIVTAHSIDGRGAGDRIAVRLASGATVDAEIVATVGRATFVTLGSVPADEPAHDVATSTPADDDMVTVLLSPPLEVTLAEVAALGAPEGTAVVDADGHLVGLCTESDDGSMGLAMVDPGADELTDGSTGSSTSPPPSGSPASEVGTTSHGTTPPTSAPAGTTAPADTAASAPASASRYG
jgi:hypothetical protein